MTTFATDVLIVGAGLAGLMAARTLVEAGKKVIVLDKGRSVGGRMATRRVGEGLADHGAQFFTVRDAEFQAYVDRWLADGVIFEWSRGWSDGSLTSERDGHPRYAVRGGMNALPKLLAATIDARVNTEINAARTFNEGWQVDDVNGNHVTARALILTPPVPQSLEVLRKGGVLLNNEQHKALESIDYEPCVTGILVVDGMVSLPAPGAIQRPGAQLTWIADNKRKGLSESDTILTVQASPSYSRSLWDLRDEEIVSALRIDLMPFIGEDGVIREAQIKRWKYSQPVTRYPERCLQAVGTPPLIFCGDAFGGPRVEGAVLSGLAAGRAMVGLIP